MPKKLQVSIGQFSDKGRKKINQDFHGVYIPLEPQLTSKGIAIALADGISSSEVAHIASEASVTGFLDDYFCTSEAWSVKKSGLKVLTATNSWLHSQSQQNDRCYDSDRGYVCTLSALILKSNMAHILHVGDTRIYRWRDNELAQLTKDHRVRVSQDKSYLSRAMGMDSHLEVEYESTPIIQGDIFLLMTDGVYESISTEFINTTIVQHQADLNVAAKKLVDEAFAQGSDDNLTAQMVRVEQLPHKDVDEVYQQMTELPFPPFLEARMEFDGFKIIRSLHASSRSHVYLAVDLETDKQVTLKIPSTEMKDDPAFLERFLMEEWIARRINSEYVLKPCVQTRQRNFLYLVTEYIEGQTLSQWMLDNPKPELEVVRGIVEQISKGLRAFHRLEMLHQDLKPGNIMIDNTGTVKIIDFGSTKVAGIAEISSPIAQADLQGTAQYTAPEYLLGMAGTPSSDLFALGVITYQMLTGNLPYGAEVARCKTKAEFKKLKYRSIPDDIGAPLWVDGAIKKAVQPEPLNRPEELSEFVYDLRHPNKAFIKSTRQPLMERDPITFWKSISLTLALVIVGLLIKFL